MIDTSTWTKFKVSDIFVTEKHGSGLQVPTGAMMSKKDLEDGDIPRVTVSNFNNGITGYYADSDDKNYRTYQNFISVSFLGTVFYQPDKVSLDMKVHCLKPLDYELNVYSAGYIVSIIRKAISNFAYSDQLSSTVLAELEFALPATSNGQPDWDYMESYMKAVMEASEKSLENLKKADDTKHLIDTSAWKEFHLYDIFDINMGNKMDRGKMSDGIIAFVGRTANNNGINARVGKVIDHEKYGTVEPYEKGCITLALGGSIGSCFIQEEPFYTSQNVAVLMPKTNHSDYALRFITSVITHSVLHGKYEAFTEELNKHIKTDFVVSLPATSTGEPDWQYMEDYMKGQFEKSELVIEELRSRI